MKMLIYVQHLLGTGHLVRALALAEAFATGGWRVYVVSGGFPLYRERPLHPAVTFIQLPPMRALPGDFTALVNAENRPIDESWKSARRDALLQHAKMIRPHAVIMETFPFGRRQLRFELLPLVELLAAMNPRPLLTSSIRDVLQQRKPKRQQETLELVESYFDLVLVHGDPNLVALDRSFPLAAHIVDRIRYTGYLYQPGTETGARENTPTNEVIVSGGGGAVSEDLLRCALAARPLSRLHNLPWRLLAGPNLSEDRLQSLQQEAPRNVVVERNRTDFPLLLTRCRLSVSQGGYNTVLDILQSSAQAVIVPYAENGETEQTTRARALQRLGRIVMLEEHTLTPENLATAVGKAEHLEPSTVPSIRVDGAEESVRQLDRALGIRHG